MEWFGLMSKLTLHLAAHGQAMMLPAIASSLPISSIGSSPKEKLLESMPLLTCGRLSLEAEMLVLESLLNNFGTLITMGLLLSQISAALEDGANPQLSSTKVILLSAELEWTKTSILDPQY